MAGTFGMKAGTYELSLEVGRPLFDRVAMVAPDLIASECGASAYRFVTPPVWRRSIRSRFWLGPTD